uniref:Nuclear transcription factor Y subunit gamma n=2 Tax=Hirondellea gigas TaxID=1518452 RepID=A0A2P2I252_9CRUS
MDLEEVKGSNIYKVVTELNGDAKIDIQGMSEAQQALSNFWPKATEEIKALSQNDLRQQELPLARIKRIMKLDEDVKMISSEAPALFSKAAEIFITELTLRAWIHTEDNKRRTLQRNDIAMAITKYDQFDFLIDIVPREEVKPTRVKEEGGRPGLGGLPTDQHYFQIAQHYQAMLQQVSNSTPSTTTTAPQQPAAAAAATATAAAPAQQQTLQIVQTSNGQVQALQTTAASPQQQQPSQQIIQIHTQQQQQSSAGGVQIIQQIVGPDGQVQQIPIQLTAQHLQMIRLQMSGASQQPIIIQTAAVAAPQQTSTATQQPQIIQLQQGSGGQPVYITQTQQQ